MCRMLRISPEARDRVAEVQEEHTGKHAPEMTQGASQTAVQARGVREARGPPRPTQ